MSEKCNIVGLEELTLVELAATIGGKDKPKKPKKTKTKQANGDKDEQDNDCDCQDPVVPADSTK